MHFTEQSGWHEFTQEVIILERRSLYVRQIRELSSKDLYLRAATNVAILYPTPFPNEYKLIKKARENLLVSNLVECSICLDSYSTELLCPNAHMCCKQCLLTLYQTSKLCPLCRDPLLSRIILPQK